MEIRNIAIIAHVDHGKTTLTDALMKQNGGIQDEGVSMDSNALEKERGITIYSKNTSIYYKDTKINIVVINKIDKPASDPHRVHDEILDLFFELGASEDQANFETIYAIGREGVAFKTLPPKNSSAYSSKAGTFRDKNFSEVANLNPLLDLILENHYL